MYCEISWGVHLLPVHILKYLQYIIYNNLLSLGESTGGTCSHPSSTLIISRKRLIYSNRAVTYPNKAVTYPDRISNLVYAKLQVATQFYP